MPIHDWTRVEAGIFHHFHHRWISDITDALNDGLLPSEYYALAEQQAAGFGPDILTLQTKADADEPRHAPDSGAGRAGLLLDRPSVKFTAVSPQAFFRRKKSTIAVRHVSGDEIIAVIEVISPGNKLHRHSFHALIEKVCELLNHRVHLLILDLLPPPPRNPRGVHTALWEEITDETFAPPADKPLMLASYESAGTVTAYFEPVAVGDRLPAMPLFLEPGAHILVPLEETYNTAFSAVPRRWREVLERDAT